MKSTVLASLMLLLSCFAHGQSLKSTPSGSFLSYKNSTAPEFPKLCYAEKYLPENKPRTANTTIIAKDSSGRLWFSEKTGKPTGVSIYDGDKWIYYDGSNSPLSNQINSILVDSKGTVWIGHSRGVTSFNNNSWKNYENITSGVCSILEDKSGKIWCLHDIAIISIFDGLTWETLTIPDYTGGAWHSALDSENNIWFTSYKGLYKYDYKTFKRYTKEDGLVDLSSFTDLKLIGNDLYSLNISGINKFNGTSWEKVETPDNIPSFSQILIDKQSKIWLLSRPYSVLFRKDEDAWTNVFLNIGLVLHIFVDNDNTFWITNHKQELYTYKNNEIKKVSKDSETSIPFIETNGILKDKRGNLWVSFNYTYLNNGFGRFDGEKWTLYPNYIGRDICFFEDNLKNVYITTYQGLLKFDGTELKDISGEIKLPYTPTGAFMIDSKQRMWFASASNVCVFDGTIVKEYSELDGIKNSDVIKISQDKKGNIWLVYKDQSYLSMFNGTSWQTFEMSDIYGQRIYLNDVTPDSLGNVWIATSWGLKKYEDDKIKDVTTFPATYVNNIAVDKDNTLWLCDIYSNKIYIYKDGYYKSYTPFKTPDNFFPRFITVDNDGTVYCSSNIYGVTKLSFSLKPQIHSKNDVSCTGASDGSLSIKTNSTCRYSIDGGKNYQTHGSFVNLPQGSYKIVEKSESGCISDTVLTVINQPEGTFEITKNDISCNGKNDGSITIATSGLDNLNYSWSNGETGSSLSNLKKGSYTVSVSHSANCNFDRHIEILEPKEFIAKSIYSNVCGTSSGMVELSIEGGTKPYSILWSNGANSTFLHDLAEGNYSVNVTDKNNCASWSKTFEIKKINNTEKVNPIDKYKEYMCSENLTLTAKPGLPYYQWQNKNSQVLGNTNTLTVENQGIYKLKVLSENNCFEEDSIHILSKSFPDVPNICMVTVDENSKNRIVWNKMNLDSAVNIVVYRESNYQGVFEKLGSVPAYKNGIFVDETSNSRVKSERYMLRAQDQCSAETNSGLQHKTIHLTANRGTNGEINLSWNNYEGITFGTYNIYRGTLKTNMNFLTSVSSSINSYSDMNPPTGGLYYQIEISLPYNCNPDARKTTYSSIRSNYIDNGLTSVNNKIEGSEELSVYPNPSANEVSIEFDNKSEQECTITITTLLGKIVYQTTTTSSIVKFEKGNIPPGVYLVIVKGERLLKSKLVLK